MDQRRSIKPLDIDLNQTERSSGQIIPQAQFLEQVFEAAIDPNSYVLGPGDQLLIKIWGALDSQLILPVSPEGYVVIPGVSEVMVSGMSLGSASDAIQLELSRSFRNSTYSVRLVKLRKFRVIVAGEVENPGTYYLRAIDRVSDAVELAGGLAGWGDDTRIQLRRVSTDIVDTVNISDFYQTGEVKENVFVGGGDIIYVPPIDLTSNYAIIEGNVGSQGIYQIRHGETLFGFLTRLRTINRKSNIGGVVLIRGNERLSFNLLDPNSGARTTLLRTADRVIVPSTQDQVYVQGEVLKPGAVPYLANYTTADYAGVAGLLETAKELDQIFVIRKEGGEIVKGRAVIVQNGDVVVVPRKRRETFKDYLTILTPLISIAISAVALSRSSSK